MGIESAALKNAEQRPACLDQTVRVSLIFFKIHVYIFKMILIIRFCLDQTVRISLIFFKIHVYIFKMILIIRFKSRVPLVSQTNSRFLSLSMTLPKHPQKIEQNLRYRREQNFLSFL
jgi:hypothetical protein